MGRNNQNKVRAYNINEIASWQKELQENLSDFDGVNKEIISLPTLQRGFVWKPYQMEKLWDSILRGYPIGSLLMSQNGKYKDLLDGQQRCTCISLGFQDPFQEPTSILNINEENLPSIWIDLRPVDKNKYGLQFGIRVLTKSHPWGYQLNDHMKTLSTRDIIDAFEYFRGKAADKDLGLLQIKLKHRVPWDSSFPVPLACLLQKELPSYGIWKSNLQKYISKNLNNVETKQGKCDYNKVEEAWFKSLYHSLEKANGLLLPELSLDKRVLEEDEDNLDKPDNDDNTTLFIRLNTEGTNLSGEELIYSLLKSVLPEAKELVEKLSLNYLKPSRVVNIFIRLVLIQTDDYKSYRNEIRLTDVRRYLKNDEFKNSFLAYIKSDDTKKLMDRVDGIFKNHPANLPKLFIKDLLGGTYDLLVVLLCFLEKNKSVTSEEENSIRKVFLLVYLFSSKKRRAANTFFKLMSESDNKFSSWSASSKGLPLDKLDEFVNLLSPENFKSFLSETLCEQFLNKQDFKLTDQGTIEGVLGGLDGDLENHPIVYSNEKNRETLIQNWCKLLKPLLWDRRFLVLAQRDYFTGQFADYMEFDGIEDTNRPWDWDHIYPNSWVYRKQKVSPKVRSLVNTNGNYRALSFSVNRRENANRSPADRFTHPEDGNENRKNGFIKDNDLEHWLYLAEDQKRIDSKDKEVIGHYTRAILLRVCNIYEDCYRVIHEDNLT